MKTITIFMMALLVVSVMPMVMAEEVAVDATESDEVALEENAGVTPDSPLYGLERAAERIRLAITFNKAKKAKLHLKYAEERLAEIEEMADEDNVEAAEEAQEAHDEGLAEAEEIIDSLETNGDAESAEEALEEVSELKERAESHGDKVARIKNRILERKIAEGKWDEEKITHMREVFDKIIAKSRDMESKMVQKKENVRTKIKVLAELSDEELAELDERIRERVEQRIEVKEKIKDRIRKQDISDTEEASEDETTETEDSETVEAEEPETEEVEADETEVEESGNSETGNQQAQSGQ